MTKLLIMRHGNTFGPDEAPRRVGCRTDIPLVESGRLQAQNLGHYCVDHGVVPDHVFASRLQRAQETAAILMASAGLDTDMLKTDERFNEIDHGPDENKTEDEIIERIGQKTLEDWNDYGVVPDGWDVDPWAVQQHWIDFAQECLDTRKDQTTAIVSSGGIIRFAPVLLPDAQLLDDQSPKVKTGSISLLVHDGHNWVCQYWNARP